MSMISQVENNAAVQETYEAAKNQKKSKVSGRTIGNPELSEKAQKYYEELKQKYSGMDFILVSEDMKEQAKAQAGNYANANRMVVLIDEAKIERMAEDENYRKQYESVISSASKQLPQLQSSLSGTSAKVKTYGMQVNDGGTASFFAVIDKSLASQKERIEKKAAEKKADAKKAEKKEAAKKAEEKRDAKKTAKKKAEEAAENEDTVMITASSIEELVKKVNDYMFSAMSDNIRTDEEKMIGQSIDYRF